MEGEGSGGGGADSKWNGPLPGTKWHSQKEYLWDYIWNRFGI